LQLLQQPLLPLQPSRKLLPQPLLLQQLLQLQHQPRWVSSKKLW
jgi:hypothetical protein